MLDEIAKTAADTMKKTMENMQIDLSSIRTGKANASLLDTIRVDYFGVLDGHAHHGDWWASGSKQVDSITIS